jgi:flavin-dependent dehydrogenase
MNTCTSIADVVVVGGGIAGLTAAEAAAAGGVRVLLIDENPRAGRHCRSALLAKSESAPWLAMRKPLLTDSQHCQMCMC